MDSSTLGKQKTVRVARCEAGRSQLDFHPLTPGRMDEFGAVLRGCWGSGCWCMYPRLTDRQMKVLPGAGSLTQRRRDAMSKLARRRRAPGLLAFENGNAVGWIGIAPRTECRRVDASRATPRVDETGVWVVPCITVTPAARGRGIAVALIQAAVAYAFEHGAPAVEAYPRAGSARTGNDNAYFGTEPMFRRAGFRVVRPPLERNPRNWVARVAMRIDAA